jgi:prophage DNA circulation protein
MSPEQQSATIIALHDAVNKIEATLNDGMKAMIAEHRIELKQIKGEVETIRTTVTSHVAKEDVLFQIFQKTLGLGIAIGGTLLATLLAVIGWLLTHQNPWLNP